jgi:hypothetical protein
VSSSVTYSATVDMRRKTVLFVSSLLHAERRRRGTRNGRRAPGDTGSRSLPPPTWKTPGRISQQPSV